MELETDSLFLGLNKATLTRNRREWQKDLNVLMDVGTFMYLITLFFLKNIVLRWHLSQWDFSKLFNISSGNLREEE